MLKADITISLEGEDLEDLLAFLKSKKANLKKREEPPKEPAVPEYQPDTNSLIDLVCGKKKVIHAVFVVLSKVVGWDGKVTLYCSADGIVCRVVTRNKKLMLDLKLNKELFDVYHVQKHVRLSLWPRSVISSMRVSKKNAFHLQAFDKVSAIKVGEFDFEHSISVDMIEQSEEPFPGEATLPEAKVEAFAEMPYPLLKEILGLNNSLSGSINWGPDALAFVAGSDADRFSKVINASEDVKIYSESAVPCRFDASEVASVLFDVRFTVASRICIKKVDSALCFEPLIDGVDLRLYMATQEELKEERESKQTTQQDIVPELSRQ